MSKLNGKIAVITGGTTGIGLATARVFHAEGATVIVTGTNPATLEEARQALRGVAEVVASDAGDPSQVEALFADVRRRFGGLDVLFLNAGIARFAPLADTDEQMFDDIIRVNVKGPWLAIRAAAPLMREGGSILITGSVLDQLGMAGSIAYSASKAAVRSLARTAAAELAGRRVRVNVVSPGPIETPIFGKLGWPQAALDDFAQKTVAKIPLARFGKSDEVARAALFLASDDATFITGEALSVDGGMTRV